MGVPGKVLLGPVLEHRGDRAKGKALQLPLPGEVWSGLQRAEGLWQEKGAV